MKKIFILYILFFSFPVFSQGEANVWYFGNNAGLDFNSGSPVALTDGQINTQESCGTISDANGNLLFYTDGIRVYTRNHSIMPNGTGLLGHASSAQSGTIAPKPGSTTLFYIFTTDNENGPNGFRYSVVDMSLNGGLGDVTSEKNVLVFTPSLENIAVTKKANNTDFWIVGHGWNSNNFYAYSLTSSGLNTTPVTSSVGAVISGTGFMAAGIIKIAPSGSKLAFTSVSDIAQLFDFDSNTGIVSNPITLSTETGELYGTEFSPDESKLYVANSFYKIYQYDLTAANIPGSKITIYNGTRPPGALQLGPDGKIYVAVYGYNKLGVINNPNTLGTGCDFQLSAIDLMGRVSSLGLPSFNRSFFDSSFRAQNLCLGSSTQFTLTSNLNVTSAVWNFGDGSPTINALNPSHNYATPGNYTVSVAVSSTAGTITKSKPIIIAANPLIASTVSNQSVCGMANMSYNLSQFNSTLLGSQSATTFGIAYFDSSINAANHTNVLPINYSLPIGTTNLFAKVYNLSDLNCYALTSFSVILSQQATATTPPDFVKCENLPYDNVEVFDLSTKDAQILNGQSTTSFTVSYHASQPDADSGSNPLPTYYQNTLIQETIFARVQNNSNISCYATTTLNLKVIRQPLITTVTNFTLCDDISNNGTASFDLSQKTNEILNGQLPSVFEVKYFYNLIDAQNNTNEITAPITNSTSNQQIFYSIAAIGNSGCRVISNFNLSVSRLPIANPASALYICDDPTNDGLGLFDLTLRNNQILGAQNVSNYSISYHLNQSDADLQQNALPLNYPNIQNPQLIYARIQNNQNPDCYATTSFQIGLHKTPTAYPAPNLFECDDDNDGKAPFDLSQQTQYVLGSQLLSDFTVTYHLNQPDANSGTGELNPDFNNTSNPQLIYARIENNQSPSCFSTTLFQLTTKPTPILNMRDEYSNCEGNIITISAPSGFTNYNWSNGATTSSTSIAAAGTYSVIVTQNYGMISCSTTKSFDVYNSNKAIISSIETHDWTDNQNRVIVHANGLGEYEYSIDGIHYQDSNVFENLPSGQYTVYVNDKKGCGETTEDLFLLMYPKFFTPNGDGFNDVWRIKFSNVEPDMELSIFDRYGKLITAFKGLDFGWDGTFNGKLQLSDDYWFVVKRQNGKEFKGHFSLLR